MASLPRTVMITGAAGNLGRAVAAAFAHEGANLVLVDLTRDSLERAFGAEAQTMQFAPTNLLDAAQVQSSVDAALGRFGRIGVLCNLAGGFRMGEPVHQTADSTWDFLLDINARTLLHSARSVVPAMLGHGGGRIVNVAAFCVAKDAVVRLTEAMSAELRNKNINVNCVLPTIIDTPENRAAMPDADPTRWVEPQDLARVIHFLASDGARAVHGAALPVTGLS
jgi:NAD(P)-dependent dehydrogenase (short-subunit alcohol dehydrogenase family)